MLCSITDCFPFFLCLLNFSNCGRILRKIDDGAQKLQLERARQFFETHTGHAHQLAQHVTEGKILQPLSHFDRRRSDTFAQRFFVNDAYWLPDGPVFLYVGGEGPISQYVVLAGHHVDMAKRNRALLLALEHRFYGDSINPDGLDTDSLGDLSSQQALADLAAFHQLVSQRFHLSRRNTWVAFGGSYAGALSAWFRGKYPHLVYGAVASSAPIRAKLNFFAYNKVVGLSLKNEEVGGSSECVAAVRGAFAAVEGMLELGNASQVAVDFNCCQIPKNHDDQTELMQNLADIFMGAVQYNEEGLLMSIKQLCSMMTSLGKKEKLDPYSRLVKVVQLYHSTTDESCLDVSHERTLKDLMDTTLHPARTAERQWLYQTCTEFGFYETCEDASCLFSKMMSLQSQTKLCTLVFGISQHSLPRHVAFTNTYYGADQPGTHRVLYINGGIDPWHELSVVHNGTEDEEQVIFIRDTAHCADMRMEGLADRSSVRRARQGIETRVAQWLKMAATEALQRRH